MDSPLGDDVGLPLHKDWSPELTRAQIFAKLQQKVDPAVQEQRERDVNERVHVQYEKAQKRQSELVGLNSTKPVTISSIRVLHATHTRRGFLERLFNPILSNNQDAPYTLQEALKELNVAVDKLTRFGEDILPFSMLPSRHH